MKRILILTLLLCLVLVSCGGEEKNDEKVNTPDTETKENTVTPGYTFDFKGASVALDAKMESIANTLGEPSSYFESESCAYQGLDKVYSWGSVIIRTYPKDSVDYVLSIELKDDSVSTPEGVSIGDTAESVEAVYGAPTEKTSSALIYRKGNTVLTFLVSEGEINAITYTRNA
ncbi:MAG: hypothetical protein E7613_00210 [Ruminococcaceae bacterium]|nr:hypothetical protein [Oscillospiraceae bacterium]